MEPTIFSNIFHRLFQIFIKFSKQPIERIIMNSMQKDRIFDIFWKKNLTFAHQKLQKLVEYFFYVCGPKSYAKAYSTRGNQKGNNQLT